MMGIIGKPLDFHINLNQRIVDLVTLVRPHLTVVDAVRILMHNGPTGGSLSDVKIINTVIASHDMLSADAYSATLFNTKATDIAHMRMVSEAGYGTLDLKKIKIKEITV